MKSGHDLLRSRRTSSDRACDVPPDSRCCWATSITPAWTRLFRWALFCSRLFFPRLLIRWAPSLWAHESPHRLVRASEYGVRLFGKRCDSFQLCLVGVWSVVEVRGSPFVIWV